MQPIIQEFINILNNDIVEIKYYKREVIQTDDPDWQRTGYNEDLLIGKGEFGYYEVDEYIQRELLFYDGFDFEFLLYGYNQPFELGEYLDMEFEKFRLAYKNDFHNIDIDKLRKIIKESKYTRSELEYMYDISDGYRYNLFCSLIKVKIEFCQEVIRYLNMSIVGLPSEKTGTTEIYKPEKQRKPLKNYENLTDLTQNQVVLLIHYLKNAGLVGKQMSNNMLSKFISFLTGFSEEKLRQGFSHVKVDSTSVESTIFTEHDYSVVRRALTKIINTIIKDTEERFPPNP